MNIEKPSFKRICLMHIQALTNFPYIEKDFDAITDYELLCKVVDYLNQVITNNNEQNDSITNLYNAFVELKDYVDDYFENLDVQDEINNKLDEMAEDGTLTNLIKSYVDPIYQAYEDTIDNQIEIIDNKVTSLASGSPLVASSTSEMTDTTHVYVNTTDGKWYYYDGDSWEIGGTYQATEISNGSVTPIKTNFMEQINKIPVDNWVFNKLLSYQTGEEISLSGASYCEEYIEIPEDETKIILMTHDIDNKKLALYYYDDSYDFLSCTDNIINNPIVTFPNGAKYFRIGFQLQVGKGDYLLFYLNEFMNGLNIYNQGKLKDDYINFDSDKILYNMKKFNILSHAYSNTIANPTIDGNKVNYTFTNELTQNSYIGVFVNWDIKVGDVLTVEVNNNFPYTKFLVFTTKQDRLDANSGGSLTEINLTNNKATLTVDSTLLSNIVDNILLLSFRVPSSEVGTDYNFDIKFSLNDDYYYFNDFIKNSYKPHKEYKAIFLGDSITATPTQNESWLTYFNQLINITEFNNVAVNGARLRDYEDTVYDGNPTYGTHSNVLGNQVQKVINNYASYVNPDFVFIAIGTNEGISSNLNDACAAYYNNEGVIPITNVDRTTDSGAFRYCNEKLHDLYPNAMIVWFTPIQANYISRPAKNIINYGESLKILCSVGSIYCIDTEKCGINGINEIRNSNGEYLKDGLHPNENGARLMGTFNAKEFKKFI